MKRCYAHIGVEPAREAFTFDVDDNNPEERRRGELVNFQPSEFAQRDGLYGQAYLAYHGFVRRIQIALARSRGEQDEVGYPSSSVYVDRMEDLV